jgi:glycosyltransferase involved in cell wall biosynthesis
MKLLIVTQVVDIEHPILGFFHRWIEEFAKHCEQVHVICLQAGKYSLPANVIIHSLGKESGKRKFSVLSRFYFLIWSLRKEYDSVFVHMNQIYVILGVPLWRVLAKRVSLWYAHGSTPYSLKVANKMTDIIFTCSKDSFKLPSKKVIVTGHGIDTHRFISLATIKDLDLITVGRITPSKNLLELVRLFKMISTSRSCTLTIVGMSVTEEEKMYEEILRKVVLDEGLKNQVKFVGKVSQVDLPMFLNRAKLFVTVAQNGSLDKAMLEAMACGLPVVSMASGSILLPLGSGQVSTSEQFIEEVEKVLESGVFTKSEYITYVTEKHSLISLVPKLLLNIENKWKLET